MWFEEQFIFFPTRYPAGYWDLEGSSIENAWFTSADGTPLHGWYLRHPDPKWIILFCHGNAGNVTHRGDVLRILNDALDASVLIFDYQGYGRSSGRPSEKAVLRDARAARAWLAAREGVAEDEIVVMGRSLGGAVAVDLAAKDGAKALILESTFTSVPDMAKRLYPVPGLHLLLRTRLDSLSKIGDYAGAVFISHGDADTIVPHDLGKRLYEAAGDPKEFYTIPHGDHNDSQPREYYGRLRSFLEEHAAKEPTP